ncbi:MAG: cytochrome b N-terminal domain-containing protein [Nitrospirota bacterium]
MARGGTIIGALTLSRFYVLHVIFLPSLITVLLIGHFAMVRRQGIAEPL